jgi:hypothetical protein
LSFARQQAAAPGAGAPDGVTRGGLTFHEIKIRTAHGITLRTIWTPAGAAMPIYLRSQLHP